ncbi:MAG: hypothetical protein A2452_06335 [Candidatus Firestonebacteria bacterium RIFOXYC2_FULL_39_67]|nr:MAG: hypothetical protein A2452_06335 [Candidatus Firestonebacteria bacterium RIFOXYC2_FULL_39_67]
MKRIMLYVFLFAGVLGLFGCGSKYESSKTNFEKSVARCEELIDIFHHRELNPQESEEFRRFTSSMGKEMETIRELSFKEKQLEEYEKFWGPKMQERLAFDKIERSLYGAYRGNLSAISSALMIYYGDVEGVGGYPEKLDILIAKKIFDKIPLEPISNSNKVSYVFDGTGGWYYNKQGDKSKTLSVVLHANLKGHLLFPLVEISKIKFDDK